MNEQRSSCKVPVVCFRFGPGRAFKGRGAGERGRVGESNSTRSVEGGWAKTIYNSLVSKQSSRRCRHACSGLCMDSARNLFGY
jgi:hypothetical protein